MAEDTIGPDIPNPDYDDPKELYAFFGLAAYCAGLLELSLLNLVAAVRMCDDGVVPVRDSDEIFDQLDTQTLGRLLADARKVVRISRSTLETLETARQKRNYLVHHFFRLHAETALSPAGRRRMIDELYDLAQLFRRADELADPLWRRAWRSLGVTDEQMQAELARMQDKASRG